MLASILYDYGRFSVEVKSTLLLSAYDMIVEVDCGLFRDVEFM